MQADSLKKRYIYKIVSKLLAIPILLATQALIPRGLGPAAYGQFTFLTNFFQQVVTFFDSGTSLAFYTRLSQKPEERSLIRFYNGFSLTSVFVIGFFAFAVLAAGKRELFFPGQQSGFIWLAILYSALLWYSETVNKIVDAYGLTVKGEKILLLQRATGLVLLLGIYLLGHFSLGTYFGYNYVILLFLILLWAVLLNRNGIRLLSGKHLSRSEINEKIRYFWTYSSPLLVYSLLTMLVSVFDNWILIKISGSVQQGYFGLAFRLSSISFLFTGAMTQLVTREFSIAHGNSDKDRMAVLFKKLIPPLSVVVTFLSVFFAVNSEIITNFFGGNNFSGAVLAIGIMSLYPIHQTYGQLSGSLFYATGQTRLYRNIGISVVPLSLLLTYILIAPTSRFGLGLGSVGLALKMVSVQFLTVNVMLFFNTKYLNISYWWFLGHQLLIIISMTVLSYFAKVAVGFFFSKIEIVFVLNGILYTIFSGIFLYMFPELISMKKSEIRSIFIKIIAYRKSK